MMVVSLDPVGHTVSMVSLPRDLVNVPLGNGDVFGPKLNSLMSYAERHPDDVPEGRRRAPSRTRSARCSASRSTTTRRSTSPGFIEMVDAVGGVDIDVKKGCRDPALRRLRARTSQGFRSIKAGSTTSTAPTRSPTPGSARPPGESDFTRAARQQQILVALRDGVTTAAACSVELPALLEAVGETIRTDLPVDRLPELAAIVDEIGNGDDHPGRHRPPARRTRSRRATGRRRSRTSTAIRTVAATLFPAPGDDAAALADAEADADPEADAP